VLRHYGVASALTCDLGRRLRGTVDAWQRIDVVRVFDWEKKCDLDEAAFCAAVPEAQLSTYLDKVATHRVAETSRYEQWLERGADARVPSSAAEEEEIVAAQVPRPVVKFKPSTPPPSFVVPASDGFLYHSDNKTFSECMDRMLFGGFRPFQHLKPGALLFLMNNQRKDVVGVFRATTACGLWERAAWPDGRTGNTK
jgi:hypothetical protein